MTFAMSTEGDSVKSALSEANDKNATDNHTTDESSQDSVDAKESTDKPVENNVNSEQNNKPKGESTEGESEEDAEKKDDEKKEEPKKEEAKDDVKDDKKEVEEDKDKKEEKKSKAEASSDKEEEEEEEDDAEEDEDGEEEEKPKKGKKKGVPLLDQPLETSGKRERKNVQRFEEEKDKDPVSTQQKVDFEDGSGTALGELPRVEASITRFKNEDLRFLHKLLFKAAANKQTQFKKNIRQFNGFSFEKESEEFKKKQELLKKAELKVLKTTCEILDIAKTGNKDEIVDRILDFLMEPKDSGKPVGGTGRPKRASAVRANNRGYSSHDDYSDDDEKHTSRARRDKGKRANLKDETSSDEEFKPGDVSDASDEKPRTVVKRGKRARGKKASSDEEDSLSEASSDYSDEPKSKRRRSVTKTPSKKAKTPGRRGRPSKAANTPKAGKKRGRKPKNVTSDEEEEDEEEDEKMEEGSSSEDEPLAKKKSKNSEPPTDDEIKTFIKSVLDGANLEEITMKTVCQRVYDNYPDFDLTARKKFIKSTVKSLIST